MKHIKITTPNGHIAVTSLLSTHVGLTFMSHWISHEVEAAMFMAGGIISACASDLERKWNLHFFGREH